MELRSQKGTTHYHIGVNMSAGRESHLYLFYCNSMHTNKVTVLLGVASLCRMMFVQSLTLKGCFHVHLLKGENFSFLTLSLSLTCVCMSMFL